MGHFLKDFNSKTVMLGILVLAPAFVFAQNDRSGTTTPAALRSTSKQVNQFETSRRPWSGAMRVGLSSERRDDELRQQKTQVGLSAEFDLKYELTPFMRLQVDPVAKYQNGFIQSESATSAKSSQFEVNEASVRIHSRDLHLVEVGAVNQDKIFDPLLVGSLAFPSVHAKSTLNLGPRTYIGAALEASVPTSSALSTNAKDFEKNPGLETLNFFGSSVWGSLKMTGKLGYFQYRDLPSGVASAAGITGNTIENEQQQGLSSFKYEFSGLYAQTSTELLIQKNLKTKLELAFVQNQKAPTELAQGSRAKWGLSWKTGAQTWEPAIEAFRVGPDSVVSYYNSSRFETNRTGYAVEMGFVFDQAFKVTGSSGERVPLYESPSQPRDRFFLLALETADVVF